MSYNPFSLVGKTILVTGASSGIGRATAIECSKMGAAIILSGRDMQRLQETFDELSVFSHQEHHIVLADLSNEDDIVSLVKNVGVIDGLVNNAGVNRVKPVAFIKKDDLDYIFQNNAVSPFVPSPFPASSVSSFYNAPGRSLYASSKAALTSFMRSFAVELADKGIRANAVHPGMIETKLIHENLTDEEREKDMAEYPLKRYGKPEEVAWAIIYLLSEASAWITGSSLVIDGGFMLK